MNQKYIIGIIAVLLIAIIGGVLFMSGSGTPERADNELIVSAYYWGGEPSSGFDPMYGWGSYGEPLIQSTLLKMNKNMTYENDLATSWEANDDFTEYTVKIRDDVKFTDNTTLDAEDVAFSFNQAKSTGSTADLSSMDNATAVDKNTIKFTLNRPDSTFSNKMLYVGIVPSDSYDNETYGSNPIGSGPYKFLQWDKGQQAILEKNPDYYGKQPEFDKLTILFKENEAAFASVKNHEVDMASVPISYANETVDGYHKFISDSYDVRGISLPVIPNTGETNEDGIPLGNNVTADKSIREALNYGINRTDIGKGALNGIGLPNYDGIAHTLPWYNKEAEIEDGDVDKAKQILKDGGWEDTDGDGIVEKDGLKASINLYYTANEHEREAIAVAVAEQAKELGIEVNVTGSNWDEMDNIKFSDPIVWGFGSSDPYTMYGEYYSDQAGIGYNNPALVNNSVVDSHMEKAMSEPREASFADWSAVSWDGTTGISPKGDAAWLWVGEIKCVYFIDDSLDISEDTFKIQPHVGYDPFGNIYDWTRVASLNETS
ncbi:ABC transporter substrate-binding protein [Methanobrevibacter sp.]|uniref:ABC transporter substrate-binding protein n=1 Tax=Methanobrevibacter sp. TaxID=66852 RepID=UPI00386FE5F6